MEEQPNGITEKWIKGYEGHYSVSDQGDVYSYKFNKKRKLKPQIQKLHDYVRYDVSLSKFGKKKILKIHILVGMTFIPNPENKPEIDHKNRDSLDNRVCNLRWATHSENEINKASFKNSSSVFKGVYKTRNQWCSRYRLNGKNFWIGSFDNEVDAAVAYDNAVRAIHGEFAVLNFPDA